MKIGLSISFLMVLSTLFYTDTDIHHEFCESELWHHRIEIFNVITSICMIYFPIQSILKREKNRNYLPEECLIAIGFGSALFHYHNTFLTSLFDEIFMLLFVCILGHKVFHTNYLIKYSNYFVCSVLIISKLCGLNSSIFPYLFSAYSIFYGTYAIYQGIIPKTLCVKLLLIVIFRQVIEDHCLAIPMIISLMGHPLWHILISKFAVEVADGVYKYIGT